MADDKNWDRELAKIDELIGKMPEEPERPERGAPAAPSARPLPPSAASAGGTPTVAGRAPGLPGQAAPAAAGAPALPSRWARLGVWTLALGSAAAAVALPFWPFGSRCGAELIVYLGAVAGTGLLGLWTATRAWRLRSPRPHAVGILVLIWALALGAWQVLPRVGAALPTPERPAIWACS